MKERTIVKKADAKKKTFKGVNLDSLAVGEKSMVTKMNYIIGNHATEHTHPHEQCGYVISGKYFIQFNTDWIEDNFGYLEDEDLDIFHHIDDSLKNGAMIYFAVENGNVLATCMAKPLGDDGLWELCKLGSNKHLPHKGAGSAVFEAAINWAIMHGAKKLFILSNSKLKAAVHIYEKYGFHEIKLEDYEYVRGDIAFEYMVPCGEASS